MMKPLRALGVVAMAGLIWIGSDFSNLRREFSAALRSSLSGQFTAKESQTHIRTDWHKQAPPAPVLMHPVLHLTAPIGQNDKPVMASRPLLPDTAINAAVGDKTLVEGWLPVDLGAAVRTAVGWSTIHYSVVQARHIVSTPQAEELASTAYWQLGRGNRQAASGYFARALARDGKDERAGAWAQQLDLLGRRWSASAYVFARSGGVELTQSALLGGGQTGAALGYTLNPLAARPIALTARAEVAHRGLGIDTASGQAAIGLRWQPASWLSITGERLFASGNHAANGWSGRIAAGGGSNYGRFILTGYGEAGFVDAAPFVGAQAFAGYRLPVNKLPVSVGVAVWAGAQNSNVSAGRIDVGPSVRMTWPNARLPIDLVIDYRRQISGNAAPASGFALTLSAAY